LERPVWRSDVRRLLDRAAGLSAGGVRFFQLRASASTIDMVQYVERV
jgi:hypothetical protein